MRLKRNGEQDHWSERGRATSVANADALGSPRRSVRSLDRTPHVLRKQACSGRIGAGQQPPLDQELSRRTAVTMVTFWRHENSRIKSASGIPVVFAV